MDKPPIKILGVDDRPANLLALEAVLDPLDIQFFQATSGQDALELVLNHDFALILLDVQMPEMDGFETASLIRTNKKTQQVPIIFVTAISFEKKYVFKGYDAGAVDYIFKPFDQHVLVSKVKIFIELFLQKENARTRALELEKANQQILVHQKALKESEIRFRTAFDQSFQFMTILDANGKILEVNELACELHSQADDNFIGRYIWDVWQFGDQKEKNVIKDCIKKAANGESTIGEAVFFKPDGTLFPIIRTISPVKDEFGQVVYITVQGHDISQRKQAEKEKLKLETQLRQAQKMEALGTLAGGIAHDFNNILSVVLGYAELAGQKGFDEEKRDSHLAKIITAANKAKDLVQQILGFSRQTVVKKISFKPSLAIHEAVKLLRASIPTTIDICLDIDPVCGSIVADPTQFHQIMINLCTNAYHAMEYNPGTLGICLNETQITEPQFYSDSVLEPGLYAHIQIKDTGIGMSGETMERIFDPYFTTKEIGKGTGMGLAIVHGIVKNHNAYIRVESKVGKGSTFHIYFPVIREISDYQPSLKLTFSKGNENILLVDDELEFITMGKEMIETLGYSVTSEQNSSDALKKFQKDPMQFDLVITGHAMPVMTGMEMAQKMLELRPEVPIILCTGYSPGLTKQNVRNKGIRNLMFKPLLLGDLSKTIRSSIDNRPNNKTNPSVA